MFLKDESQLHQLLTVILQPHYSSDLNFQSLISTNGAQDTVSIRLQVGMSPVKRDDAEISIKGLVTNVGKIWGAKKDW